jgi:hypothetical protein
MEDAFHARGGSVPAATGYGASVACAQRVVVFYPLNIHTSLVTSSRKGELF